MVFITTCLSRHKISRLVAANFSSKKHKNCAKKPVETALSMIILAQLSGNYINLAYRKTYISKWIEEFQSPASTIQSHVLPMAVF